MSIMASDHHSYTIELENIIGRLCGIVHYLLVNEELPNKDHIKNLIKNNFEMITPQYFEIKGGATLEVISLLHLVNGDKNQ